MYLSDISFSRINRLYTPHSILKIKNFEKQSYRIFLQFMYKSSLPIIYLIKENIVCDYICIYIGNY